MALALVETDRYLEGRLWVALAAVVIVQFLPIVRTLIADPMELAGTAVHEVSHWLTGRLIGIRKKRMEVSRGHGFVSVDLSSRPRMAAMAVSGYTGTVFVGAAALVLNAYAGFETLWLVGLGGFLMVTGVALVDNLSGRLGLIVWGVLMVSAGVVLGGSAWAGLLADFTALMILSDGLLSQRVLFRAGQRSKNSRGDAALLARALVGPPILWALVMLLGSLVAAVAAVRWRLAMT